MNGILFPDKYIYLLKKQRLVQKKSPGIKSGTSMGNQWGSNPRPSESQSDALTN